MEDKIGKSFTIQRRLSFKSILEIVKEFQPISMERLLAKVQIKWGLSEEKTEKQVNILLIDKRITLDSNGLVIYNEAENE